jgi:hypothetical protein
MDWSDDMVVTWVGDMKWHVEMENTLNSRIWPPWKEEVAYRFLIGVRCLLCLQSIYHLNVYKLQACVELTSIPPTLQGSMGNLKPLIHANLFNEQKMCIQERLVSTTKTSARPLAKANMIWKLLLSRMTRLQEGGPQMVVR